MKNYCLFTFPSKIENVKLARNLLVASLSEEDFSFTDLSELKTVLSEAVTNAIVHGYENDENKEVEVGINIEKDKVILTITDFGKGIEDISKARTPMYSTKLSEERAGLGFTIMEVFTDELIVDSKVGYGTTVKMTKMIASSCEDD